MVAIKLYDIETGHVQTLTEVASPEHARAWLDSFRSGGIGTNDVLYTAEIPPPRTLTAQAVTQLARSG